MAKLGLEKEVLNQNVLKKTVGRFKERKIKLPTYEELADPSKIPSSIVEKLKDIDPSDAHPLNLYRIHWYNEPGGRGFLKVPHHVVLDKKITGIDAKIVVMIGNNFPMVNCHKVLPAYGCLAPRLVTGQFDPTKHKAIWPSTGNYCRGGVAVSRIMDCHGVAILPEEMSQERFDWLNKWTMDPAKDIYKTYGCESNVKEIYDKCNELAKDPTNIIFNQFCEFGNTIIHYKCTGTALENVYNSLLKINSNYKPKAFVSATGSAGTIAAGDYLKEKYSDFKIAAVEALECPTLFNNGFGGHNIQGIGDKHVPLVHNVMNSDYVIAVSDAVSDCLVTLFNTKEGREYLINDRGLSKELVDSLQLFGISSIANIAASIKLAKYNNYTEDDIIFTVATDSALMYKSEIDKSLKKYYNNDFDRIKAAETFGQYMMALTTDSMEELTKLGRERIFNLGYYTWVEQQGITIEEFNARKDQSFWKNLRQFVGIWDNLIREFNREVEK